MEMTDEELKEYIPQKGDRIVVKAFACKEKNETQSEKRKLTLLENLRAKMTTKSAKKTSPQVTATLRYQTVLRDQVVWQALK